MSTDAATPSFLEFQQQQALALYARVKTKIANRYGSAFVQDIPGKKGFSMRWFTKTGGHAVVNVIAREAYGGLRIEFTRNTVSGISDEAGTAEKPALDVQLNRPRNSGKEAGTLREQVLKVLDTERAQFGHGLSRSMDGPPTIGSDSENTILTHQITRGAALQVLVLVE